MIKGLMPNINIFIMPEKEEDEESKSMLSSMLKKKEKRHSEMMAKMEEMKEIMKYRPGTSHVGGG